MKSEQQGDIKVNGRVIPIKSVKLREIFSELQAKEAEITNLKSSGSDNQRLVAI